MLRSSRPQVFFRKDAPGIIAKFAGKHLCPRLLFNKVAGSATLLKRVSGTGVFLKFCMNDEKKRRNDDELVLSRKRFYSGKSKLIL